MDDMDGMDRMDAGGPHGRWWTAWTLVGGDGQRPKESTSKVTCGGGGV